MMKYRGACCHAEKSSVCLNFLSVCGMQSGGEDRRMGGASISSSAAASPRVPPNFQTERVMPQAPGPALDGPHAQQHPLGMSAYVHAHIPMQPIAYIAAGVHALKETSIVHVCPPWVCETTSRDPCRRVTYSCCNLSETQQLQTSRETAPSARGMDLWSAL